MSTDSYLIAWVWYLGASLVLMWTFWRTTRRLPLMPRQVLRVLVAGILLVPWSVQEGHASLAPAWLVTAFDAVMKDDVGAFRAGKPLIVFTVLALLVVLGRTWYVMRGQQSEEADNG